MFAHGLRHAQVLPVPALAKFALPEMSRKQDFPPLLPEGLHSKSATDIKALCVSPFPYSTTRPQLFEKLCALVEAIAGAGVEGHIWVDGSFVTNKEDPNDVDIVLWIANYDTLPPSQERRIGAILKQEKEHRDNGCDLYPSPPTKYWLDYWQGQFGTDRTGNPKGIVTMPVNRGSA